MPSDANEARNFVTLALRRLRLEAAVALAEQRGLSGADAERLATRLDEARRAEHAARQVGDDTLPISELARRLKLRPLDETVLWAAVALESDPLFAITMSGLAGEEPRAGLSAKLVAQLCRFAGDDALTLRLDGTHPLVEAGILEPGVATLPDTLRPYRVAHRAAEYLAGSDEIDGLLRRAGAVLTIPEHADFDYARPLLALLDRVMAAREDVIVCIEGLDGVGRRTAVALAARRSGKDAVALDAGRLSPDPVRRAAELRALRRECWLRSAVPVVARLDALSRRDGRTDDRLTEVSEALEPGAAVGLGPTVITCAPGTELPEFKRRVLRARLDSPDPGARARIWMRALGRVVDGADGGDPTLDPAFAEVVRFYALTPGGIQRAAANAKMLAAGRPLEPGDVRAGVSAEIQERFSGLASRVSTTERWEDLVLPQDTLDDIRAFTSRASHAALVYDRWGFREKLGRGLGLAALFSGPPGTGKTMVAGLIARTLGLEMYQVDLSQVVSKWVGETEKQLGKIFDAAAMGHCLLLFDEADALFAKRTEVKSSNDRYANLEVNYLLQRIEAFGGVAILTTNLEASVDPAFKRRLAADVRFYPPDKEERERLWQHLIPDRAPVEPDLTFEPLADTFKEMCGGHIRNAVLRAAFLAASESQPISQEHLLRAARSEYRSMGKVL